MENTREGEDGWKHVYVKKTMQSFLGGERPHEIQSRSPEEQIIGIL